MASSPSIVTVESASSSFEVGEAVLFPFDDYSIPFRKDVLLTLIPGSRKPHDYREGASYDPDHPGGPVVELGADDDCDSMEIVMPTVLEVEGEYRMWYYARGNKDASAESPHWGGGEPMDPDRRLAYATSKDGIHWEKPKLGLVGYNGNRENNLVDVESGNGWYVVYDPEDPDAARKFKMISMGELMRLQVHFSGDGLTWTKGKVVGQGVEPAPPIKFKGCWYLNGQGGPGPFNKTIPHPVDRAAKREMVTWASYDFETWTQAAVPSFRRDPVPPRPIPDFEWHRGEQVHQGAALWNRGNVILGIYGMYHNDSNDRLYATMDLGLLVSQDAMHYREPVPDFKIVPCFEEFPLTNPGLGAGSKIMQSASANIGERTFHFYTSWEYPSRGMVRVATWPRDRLGFFSAVSRPVFQGQGYKDIPVEPHVISCPLHVRRDDAGVYLNVDGLGQYSQLRVELLDLQFRPIPGYSGQDCVLENAAGLRQRAAWKRGDSIGHLDQPVRVRVNWEGVRPEDARLYGVYVA
jgi:hypothetical protein